MTESPDRHQRALSLAIAAANIADDEHGRDIVVLEVGAVTIVADYFVVASAPNRRLVRRITESVEERLSETLGEKPLRVEGLGDFDWVVLDYGDVMVHVFGDEIRAFYEIERLYGDVPVIDWGGPSDVSEDSAEDSQSE